MRFFPLQSEDEAVDMVLFVRPSLRSLAIAPKEPFSAQYNVGLLLSKRLDGAPRIEFLHFADSGILLARSNLLETTE